ncbi:MAG TPA: glycerophosphodiester phosphodiesterase family protein [Bacteriovoracaceae bacterium]|nr:glycerophosphodiester phosphodiesterase family protein [Bacteriovoracaceae bacterium]
MLSILMTALSGCNSSSPVKTSSKKCPFFPEYPSENENYGKDFFIAHGGGGLDSYAYTNSVEAVEYSIKQGYRLIEIDLAVTTDGKIVGVHDWAHFNKITGYVDLGDKALSFKEVKSRKIHGSYTPITFIEIEKIFSSNPDLVLVTDKINDFQALTSTFSFLDRMVVEIFSLADYELAIKEGILHPMLSAGENEFKGTFIKDKGVKMLAVHSGLLNKFPELLQSFQQEGMCIFAFSSNEDDFIKKNLKGNKATAFYTDFWDIKNGKCSQTKAECTTY